MAIELLSSLPLHVADQVDPSLADWQNSHHGKFLVLVAATKIFVMKNLLIWKIVSSVGWADQHQIQIFNSAFLSFNPTSTKGFCTTISERLFLSLSVCRSQNVTSTFVVSPNILKKIYEFWDMGKIELESSIPDLRMHHSQHNIQPSSNFPTFPKHLL